MVEVNANVVLGGEDSYMSQAYPDTNYGTNTYLDVYWVTGIDMHRTVIKVKTGAKPATWITEKPKRIRLRLYLKQSGSAGNVAINAYKTTKPATEAGVTYNKFDGSNAWDAAGGDLETFLSMTLVPNTPYAWYEWDITGVGLDWGESCWIILKCALEATPDKTRMFDSAEGTYLPYVIVTYDDESPTAITDLKAQGDSTDRTKTKLTWSANQDVDFVNYKIRKSLTSPVTYASSLLDTITNQAQTEYIDASVNTENTAYYYAIFVEDVNNTGANSVKSNEVFAIRPDVSSFAFSTYGPALFQKITGTITSATHVSTPVPITDDLFYFQWGSGSDLEQSYAWQGPTGSLTSARTHRYPYTATYHPKAKVRNSLGLESDLTAASDVTVQDAYPIAKIRASNMLATTSETITFYGDESFCPAGNKSIKTPNGYAWDWDYTGSFSVDEYTTLPVVTHSWGSAGTKAIGLQVSDGTNWSGTASMEVTVAVAAVVNLDSALTDGYDVLDYTDGRRASLLEGPEAWEIASGTQMPREAMIGGFAYTDTDVDGTPDDIETLNDIVTNGKKVSITLDGTSRTGIINGKIQKHKEGGYVGKVEWSCQILLE